MLEFIHLSLVLYTSKGFVPKHMPHVSSHTFNQYGFFVEEDTHTSCFLYTAGPSEYHLRTHWTGSIVFPIKIFLSCHLLSLPEPKCCVSFSVSLHFISHHLKHLQAGLQVWWQRLIFFLWRVLLQR